MAFKAFHIHRAERTDLLADGLAELLATPQPDPFAQELILVPARGIERWLSQRLSHRLGRGTGTDGVCAGVQFRSPRSLIAELTGTADADPWAPDSLVWPLLETIDASAGEPWCRLLAEHLGYDGASDGAGEHELRQGRRHAVARRIAALLASYAAQRPQILIDWLEGRDTDGIGGALDDDLLWQPALWRALVPRVGADPPHVRHRRALDDLNAGAAGVPPRLSLFGQTRLPATDIELLEALSVHHDVHLWIPHPSGAMWSHNAARQASGPRRRASTPDRGHPLLITLGRDVRELQHALPVVPHDAEIIDDTASSDDLLGWLKTDLSADELRPHGRVMAPEDRSVRVHSCHGPARQVDVLRDVLLGALADDPTLQPRDILVMCPDIDTYAPLIMAGFGLGDAGGAGRGHPAHGLRVRLADRAPTQTNPLLAVLSELLDLVDGRCTASEILNLAEMDSIRLRFGFTDDDLDVLNRWVRETGIRWGFDRSHRDRFGLGGVIQNTWRFGIDRILCGVAMSDDSAGWLDTTLPLDDVGSNQVELAGRFAEFIDRLQWTVDTLSGTKTLSQWLDLLSDGVQRLTRVGTADGWQLGQVHREFADIIDDAGPRRDVQLRLNDIRSLLKRYLAGRPTRANFRSGSLTVCTMVPMRSVPHRVVCLVGLDDGIFPRAGVADGDDVLAREPVVGERDIRSEDRQLLLDAIGAATEKVVITYTGADEYTGQRRPPCVPLAEVLDALDRTTSKPVREQVVIEHPLQPFDVRNVTPGELDGPLPFTFDRTALVAARAAAQDSPAAQRDFLPGPLPQIELKDIALEDFLAFFRHPAKAFFRGFGVALPFDVDVVKDVIPLELSALEQWAVGDRMLDDMLRGHDPAWTLQAEWRRGHLPPGRLGWREAQRTAELAGRLASTAFGYRTGSARAVDVDIDLGAGRRLTGTVNPVHGDRIVSVTYSKLAAKHLLQAWIQLLALCVAQPARPWEAICVGRRRRSDVAVRSYRPPKNASEVLADLVAVYDAGCLEPIPLPLKTSYAWADARQTRSDPYLAALGEWKSGEFGKEDADGAHVRAWGKNAPLEVLLRPAATGDQIPGETTRLGVLAARVWAPLLAAEREARG